MSDIEVVVLEKLVSMDGHAMISQPSVDELSALKHLIDLGYVTRSIRLRSMNVLDQIIVYSITPAGRIALLAFQEARRQAVDEQRYQACQQIPEEKFHNRKLIPVFRFLSSILAMILAAIVGQWIMRLFGWL